MSRDLSGYSVEQLRDQHNKDKFHTRLSGVTTALWACVTGIQAAAVERFDLDLNAIVHDPNKLLALGSAATTAVFGGLTALNMGAAIQSGQELAVHEYQEAQTAEAQAVAETITIPPAAE